MPLHLLSRHSNAQFGQAQQLGTLVHVGRRVLQRQVVRAPLSTRRHRGQKQDSRHRLPERRDEEYPVDVNKLCSVQNQNGGPESKPQASAINKISHPKEDEIGPNWTPNAKGSSGGRRF
ncbi:hypothetical protein Mapa_000726 [Marchantia paleacea]|nr:hypothetical protein Mapa_000726 [Marchantia paleacea]